MIERRSQVPPYSFQFFHFLYCKEKIKFSAIRSLSKFKLCKGYLACLKVTADEQLGIRLLIFTEHAYTKWT